MRNHYVTEAEEELSSLKEEGFFDTAKDFFFGTRITDLTAEADKSKRKKQRDPKSVYALVLHQMACCFKRKDPLKSYLRTNSHFVILPDGKILQLHPISAYLWASHGFNKGSVAVEFAGNFPSTRGKWWKGDKYGQNQVTPEQIEAGRYLVRHLIRTMGLTHVLAHRQSSAMRENDPGPDIWYHVGQWAIDNHGLKDGGPGFKVGDGHTIPDLWRTWGKAKPQPELEEEIDPESSMHERWLQQALNRTLDLRLRADDAGGPAVRSALRSFQRRHGLPADGELSEEVEQLLVSAGASPHNHPPSRETRKADREDLELPATTTPTPGRFYNIQYAQGGLLKTAERAYGSVAERQKWAQIINNHPLNRKFWRKPENDYERRVFSDGVISFSKRFTCESKQRVARSSEKKCFSRIMIPSPTSAFFQEYELRFNPDEEFGIPANPYLKQQMNDRISDVKTIVGELERRLNRRATDALNSKVSTPTKVSPALEPVARRLSKAQLALFQKFFGGAGTIDFKKFQSSFELFANGQLRETSVGRGYGEPDGAFYFLFAEFAFLCIDSGIDKTVWEKALRSFVKTQEIFMHIYRPAPHDKPPPVNGPLPQGRKPRRLEDFKFDNFNAVGQSDISRLGKLRAKYDKMDVRALREAARDNLRRALLMH
jgi:peptidoglycan hydrolase-like protein with peptidoglycan-binding domain